MDVRAKILEEATRLFAAQGVDGTAIQEIADAVGVAKPSLLYHFPSKDALHKSVLEHLLSRWSEIVPHLLRAVAREDRFDAILDADHRLLRRRSRPRAPAPARGARSSARDARAAGGQRGALAAPHRRVDREGAGRRRHARRHRSRGLRRPDHPPRHRHLHHRHHAAAAARRQRRQEARRATVDARLFRELKRIARAAVQA